MKAVPVLAALAFVLLAVPASGQTAVEGPKVTRSRGLTTLSFRGTLPPGLAAADARAVSLRRGARATRIGALEVGDGGAFTVEIRTARILSDGDYTLEIGAAGASPLRHAFRLGDADSAQAAAARMLAWYGGATSTFRALTAALERRGVFHKALADRDSEGALVQQELFEAFLDAWRRNLRMARMDLATYQRRVLLPSLPEAGDALVALVPLLLARSEAWEKALQPFGRAPGPNAEVEARAARLRELVGRDAALDAWRAGRLGEPPPAEPPAPGPFTSPLGFSLEIPDGAEFKAPRTPYDRLEFSVSGVTAIVRVEDRPSETTPDALTRRLETDAWETWDSYKRLASERLPEDAGVRLEFRALYRGRRVAVVQRSLFPPAGETTVVSLLVFRADGVEKPPAVQTLEDSLRRGGGQ